MRFLRTRRGLCALVLFLGLWTAPAFGQACAMCYANAKATPKDGQQALNRAIFVMLVPPLGIMSIGQQALNRAIFVMLVPPLGIMSLGVGLAFRYGKRRDREQE